MRRKDRVYTVLLLIAVLLNGLLWSIVSPLWQGPDESGHYATVQFIGQSLRLPEIEEAYKPDEIMETMDLIDYGRAFADPERRQDLGSTYAGPNEELILSLPEALRTSVTHEFGHTNAAMKVPPLYHVLASVMYCLTRPGSILTRGFAVRLVSVCCATSAVYVCVQATRATFPGDQDMHWTLPILFGFHPMFTFLGSVVSPEILLVLEMTLFAYIGVLVIRHGLNWQRAVALGATLAAGIMTRPEMWAMGLPLSYLLLVELYRKKVRAMWLALVMIIVVAVCAGWWLFRSYHLNQNIFYVTGRTDPSRPPLDGYYPWHYLADYADNLWNGLFRSYWGGFGHTLTQLPSGWYAFLRGVVVISIIGTGWHLFRHVQSLRRGTWGLVFGLLALCAVSVAVALGIEGYSRMLRVGAGVIFLPAKGRYLIGPLMAQMVLLAVGLTALFPIKLRWLGHLFLRLVILTLNAGALVVVLIPRYYL